MHELIAQAASFGEVATLHPLFVGGPIAAGVAAGWIALRRRRRAPLAADASFPPHTEGVDTRPSI